MAAGAPSSTEKANEVKPKSKVPCTNAATNASLGEKKASLTVALASPLSIVILLGSMFFSFSVGRVTRRRLFVGRNSGEPSNVCLNSQLEWGNVGWNRVCGSHGVDEDCREIGVEDAVRDYIIEPDSENDEDDDEDDDGGEDKVEDDEEEEEDDEDEGMEGQDLLLDIRTTDLSLAESEESVLRRMATVLFAVDEMTMKWYHCHQPWKEGGFSCVGMSNSQDDKEAGRIWMHTWPDGHKGVQVALDIFLNSKVSGIALVKVVRQIFNLAEVPTETQELSWSYKLHRVSSGAWSEGAHLSNPYLYDLGTDLAQRLHLPIKKQIVTVQTVFQRIDIYDALRPSLHNIDLHRRSLEQGRDLYEAQHPQFYSPERFFLLDGVMQSISSGEGAYHESLVHPALFAHPNPKRVAIIGGGEGATLREVLKHDTVEKATMIDIDQEVVTVSRDYLPQWCDCSDLAGSAAWCPNDPRADMRYEDAFGWFMTHFSDENMDSVEEDELFDVIIGDALDPADHVEFASDLYGNERFSKSLYNALSPQGVLVMQVGEASMAGIDVPEFFNVAESNYGDLQLSLQRAGFESFHQYEEAHCRFSWPWSFVVAFKSFESRQLWYANAPEINLAIQRRIRPTVSGEPTLKYFDGATQQEYQRPHKADGVMHCRQIPRPKSCDAPADGVLLSDLEMTMAKDGEWSVVSKVSIPAGSQIAVDMTQDALHLVPSSLEVVQQRKDIGGKAIGDIVTRYGIMGETKGKPHASMSPIMSLLLDNLGYRKSDGGNVEVRRLFPPPRNLVHNVTAERHLDDLLLDMAVFVTRDIKAGESIHC